MRTTAFAAVWAVVMCGSVAQAQVNGTWTDTAGANNGLMSNAGNWIGGNVPTAGTTTTLTFGLTTGTTLLNQDLANPFLLNKITFTNVGGTSSQYTLGGGEFRFQGTSPTILVSGATTTNAVLQTINNQLSFLGSSLTLQVDGANLNALRINGNITASSGGAALLVLAGTSTNSNNTIAGQLFEAGGSTLGIQKIGTGRWNITSSNSITGGVSILAGTLNLSGSNAFGGGVSVAGGTGNFTGTNSFGGGAFVSGGTLNVSGSNAFAGGVSTTGGVANFSGTNSITGAIVVNGGTLAFSGANTFGGNATIIAGQLQMSNAQQLLAGHNLRFQAVQGTPGVLETSGTLTNLLGASAGQIQFSGSSGGFSAVGGALDVTLNNDAGTPLLWDGAATPGGLAGTTELQFNSVNADDVVTFHNALLLGAGAHQVFVTENSTTSVTSESAVMSGLITGSGGLIKLGNGSLVLSGNNTFTGGLTVSGGILNVTGSTAMGGGIAVTSGTLNFGGNNTFNGDVLINGGSAVLSGVSSFTGGIAILTGTGNLSGDNAFTGGVSIAGGALTVGGSSSFGGGVSISGGTGNFSSASTIAGPVAVTGGTLTLGGAITVGGPVTVSAGALVVGASLNPVTSGIWVNGGTLRANSPGGLEFGGSPLQMSASTVLSYSSASAGVLTRSFSLAGTGTFTISGDGAGALTVTNTINYLNAGARTLVLAGGGAGFSEYQSQLSDVGGALSLRKSGAGTWAVTNTANNFTGGTTILAGSLRVTDINAQLLAAGSLRFGTTAGTVGVLETSGSLTTSLGTGVGQMSFGGTGVANQNSGGFSAFGGPLSVTINNNASTPISWNGAPAGTNLTGTTELQLNSPDSDDVVTLHNSFTLGTGSHRIRVTDNTTATTDWAVMSGTLSGAGGIAKVGTGMLVLTASNNFTGGVSINGGILQVANAAMNLNLGTNLVNFNNATAGAGGVLQTAGSLSFAGVGTGAGQVSWIANGGGGFSALGGALSVTLTTDTVTPILWAGSFVNGTGELVFSSTNADNVVTLNNAMNFGNGVRSIRVYDNTTTNNDYAILAGSLTGSGGLNKVGTGLLVLTGNNTFTGGATITSGILRAPNVQTNLNAAANNITFTGTAASPAVLEGAGSITNALGTGAGTIAWGLITPTNVSTASGGFSAFGGALNVTLSNDAVTPLNWTTGTTTNPLAAGSFVGGAGELQFGSIYSDNIVTFNNPINLSNGARTIRVTDNPDSPNDWTVMTGTISSLISASGSLTKQGTGTLILTADNTYTGTTTIAAGTLGLGNGGSTGNLAGNIRFGSAATSLLINHDNIFTFGGNLIVGAGGVTISGATSGGVRFDTAMTYTGGTTVQRGTLRYGINNAIVTSRGVTLNSTGTLDLNGFNGTVAQLLDGTGGGGVVINNGGSASTLTISSTTLDTAFTGVIKDGTASLGLVKAGAGTTLTLGGANNYTGGTRFVGGTIFAASGASLGSGNLTFAGGTLQMSGAQTLNQDVVIQGPMTVVGDAPLTFNGIITNSGVGTNAATARSIVSSGGGIVLNGTVNLAEGATSRTLTLAGDAGITINGIIQNGGTATSGTINITNTSAAGIIFANNNTFTGRVSIQSGALLTVGTGTTIGNLPGLVTVSTGGTLKINRSDVYQYGGVISGGGTIVVNGPTSAGLQLNAANTYTGLLSVNQGIIRYGLANAVSTAGELSLNQTATLDLNGFDGAINTLSDGALGGGWIVNNSSTADALLTLTNGTFTGTITDGINSHKIGLIVGGSAATTITLGGNNTFSGGLTLAGGTLFAATQAALGSTSTPLIFTGGGLAMNGNQAFTQDVVLRGTASFSGDGQITLSGTVTNSGGNRTLNSNVVGGLNINGPLLMTETSTTGRTLTLGGTGPITINSPLVFGAVISDTSVVTYTLNITNTSNVILAKDNVTSLLTVSNGTLNVGRVTIQSGGVLTVGAGGTTGNLPTIVTNSGTLNFNRSDFYDHTGTIAGSGDLTVTSPITGGVILGTATTYSGDTTINSGTLKYGVNNALRVGAVVAVNSTGTLDLNGFNGSLSMIMGTTNGVGTIANNSDTASVLTFTTTSNPGDYAFTGRIIDGTGSLGTGTLGLNKTGTNTITLAGNNAFSGNSTFTAGTIVVANNNALGTASWFANGGRIAGDGTPRTIGNAINTLTNGFFIDGNSALTFSGSITNSGGNRTITVNNTGVTTFKNINLAETGAVVGRTLTMNLNGPATVTSIANGGTLSGNLILNLGYASTLTLNGTTTYNGTTTVTGTGTIFVNGTGHLGSTLLSLNSGATLHVAPGGVVDVFSGGGIAVNNGSTLYVESGATLANTSPSADINVNSGGLFRLDGLSSSGNIRVDGSGLLTGAGNPGGAVFLTNGGTLAPGSNGPAQFTLSGLSVQTGGVLEYQLGTPGVFGASDRITIDAGGDGPTIASAVVFIQNLAGFSTGTYTLIDGYNFGISGAGAFQVASLLSGYRFTVADTGTELRLTVTNSPAKILDWTSNTNGNWDTTTANWTLTTGGGAVTYSNSTSSNAMRDFVNFGDSASIKTINITAATVTPGNIIFNNATTTYTISGVGKISGTTNLILNNTGTVVLLNGANDYTGITQIVGGTLQVGDGGTVGNTPLTGKIINNGRLIFNRGGTLNNNAAISGTGQVLVNGPGTLVYGGIATNNGGWTISSGTVQLTGTGRLPTSGGWNVAGGSLIFGIAGQLTDTLNISSGLVTGVTTTTASITAAVVNQSGGLLSLTLGPFSATTYNMSGGTLDTLAGSSFTANSLAVSGGNINVAGGVVDAALLDLQSGVVSITGGSVTTAALRLGGNVGTTAAVHIAATRSIVLQGNVTFSAVGNPLGAVIDGAGTIDFNGAARTFSIGDSTATEQELTVAVALAGSDGFVKSGAGALYLTGTNNLTSTNTISAGTLVVDHGGVLGSGKLVATNTTAAIRAAAAPVTLSNLIQLNGTLTITGSTALTFTTSPVINSGGNRTLNASNSALTTIQTLQLSEATANRTLTITGSGLLAVDSIVPGNATAANLIISGNGLTLTLNNANTYNGDTSVRSGSVMIGHAGAFGVSTENITVATITGSVDPAIYTTAPITVLRNFDVFDGPNSTVTFGGRAAVVSAFAGAINFSQSLNLSSAAGGTVVFNALTDLAGTAGLTKIGNGIATLGGPTSYGGATTITAGTLRLAGADDRLPTGTSVMVDSLNGATFDLGGVNQTIASLSNGPNGGGIVNNSTGASVLTVGSGSFSGGLQNGGGTLSLVKNTAGTLTLGGTSNYTGATVVSAGKLVVNGTLGATAVSVGTGGTLAGSGKIGGTVTTAGGIIAPGNSAGTLTVGGLVLNGGTLQFEIGTIGAGSDHIFSGGVPIVSATTQFSFTALTGFGAGTYSLISGYTGSLAGADFNRLSWPSQIGLYGLTLVNRSNSLDLDVVLNAVQLVWTGNTDANWDTVTDNWTGGSSFFTNDDTMVTFNNSSLVNDITIASEVRPGLMVVDNDDEHDYAFSGAAINSAGVLTKTGIGSLTFANDVTFSGGAEVRMGTLNLGTGGATGLFTGNIANSGVVAVNLSGTNNWGNVISGTGAASFAGGTIVLTVDQTYSGVTSIISGGVLQLGTGGTTGLLPNSAIVNDGKLIYNVSAPVIQSLGISGGGSVQIGTNITTSNGGTDATVTFLANNTYAGRTTIGYGSVLNVGNGGTTGALIGNVTNSGELNFTRTDSSYYPGIISGTGTVTFSLGTFTLTGDNNYTGRTTINAGAVVNVGDGGLTGALAGTIGNAGTLNFNRSADLTYGGIITGAGVVTFSGPSIFTLTHNSNYTGTTTIYSGAIVRLGNGLTSSGSLGNTPITNEGKLIFNRTGTINRTLDITGGGAVQIGDTVGTFVNFRADMSYTGATTILSGSTLQLGNVTAAGSIPNSTVYNEGLLIYNRTGTTTRSLPIIGGGGVQIGNGATTTVVFTTDQTYSGGTTINSGGTLILGAGGASGMAAGILNNGALIFNRGASFTYTDVITGNGSVSFTGANFTFAASQQYTGVTTVAAGSSLQLGLSGTGGNLGGNVINFGSLTFSGGSVIYTGAISDAGSVLINSGPVYFTGSNSYQGTTTIMPSQFLGVGNGGTSGSIVGNVTNSGTLAFNRSTDLIYGNIIKGDGAVSVSGGGSITFTNDNTYSGPTTIFSTGVLQLGGGGTGGSVVNSIIYNDGRLVFDRSVLANHSTDIIGGGGVQIGKTVPTSIRFIGDKSYTGMTTITAGSSLLLGNGTLTGAVAGSITNSGTLNFNRPGSLTYSGTISGNGIVTFSTGSYVFANDQTYTGDTSIAAGVNLQFGLTGSGGGIASANITNSGTLTFSGGNALYNGVIGGLGKLTVNSGMLTLAGVNTYTGGTTINAGGVLRLGNNSSAGSITGSVSVAAGGLLVYNRNIAATLTNAINGAGGLSVNAGTLTFTIAQAYSGGTTIAAGTLQLGNSTANGSVAGNITNSSFLILNRSGTYTFSNVVDGSGAVTVNAGNVTFNGLSNYTGNTTIVTGATAVFSDGGSTASSWYHLGGALTFSNTTARTFNGGMSGAAGFTKDGAGTLTFNGNGSTFTGQTTIAAGALVVNGTLGNGAVSIGASGTLGGNGTIGGIVTSLGTIAPSSASAVTGTVSLGALILNGGSLNFDLGSASDHIQLASGTTLTVGGITILNFNPLTLSGFTSGTYSLIGGYTGTLNSVDFNRFSLNGVSQLNGLNISLSNLDGSITLYVEPPPSINLAWVGNNGSTWDTTTVNWTGDATIFANDQFITSFTNSSAVNTITVGPSEVRPNGMIVNNDTSHNYSFSGGAINSIGALTKTGDGSLTFANAVNFLNGATVSAGTLQIGAGGSTGSFDGNIVNNAAVVFNRSGNLTYTHQITGTGTVSFGGGASYQLTGSNNYTGQTSILAGTTLQLGSGGSTGAIVGSVNVANTATLAFNRSGSLVYSGVLSGGGRLSVDGGLSLALTSSSSSFSGPLSLISGNLTVSGGSFTSGALSVSNGTLTVTAGGLYQSVGGSIGRGGVTGTMIVSGTGSTWTAVTTNLFIGDTGTGSLNVQNGGFANHSTVDVFLGYDPGVRGFVTIDGTGSHMAVDDIGVGISGIGSLTIQNSGMLVDADGAFLALNAGSTGSATVTGPGSQWTINNLLIVGSGGTGAINVANQGLVISRTGYLGSVAGATGTAVIDGANSRWSVTNALYLGGSDSAAGGAGTMTVTGGGAVTVGGLAKLWSTGGLTIGASSSFTAGSLSGTGNILNDGTLTVGGDNTSTTYAGIINGGGALAKLGNGTLILSSNQTYTGVTTIAAGTLQLGAGANGGQLLGSVTNSGVLTFSGASTSYSGTINGTGAVAINSGTVIFTADNGYTGTTTIATNATLQLGNGGTEGAIGGNLYTDGKLIYNRSNTFVYGGAINPQSNATVQVSSGKLVLTGSSGFLGATIFSGATLQFGNGGTPALADTMYGIITNSGDVVFNYSSSKTALFEIAGPGNVTFTGGGRTIFDANRQIIANTITIDSSTLAIADFSGDSGETLVGSITNNGTLVVFNGASPTINGAISGTGSLLIQGGLTLGGVSTYSGVTTVDSSIGGGVLVFENGGSITGSIVNTGEVRFSRTGALTYGGIISGTGLVNINANSVTFTNNHTYTGGTSIASGATLVLGGTLGSIAGDVTNSGTLSFDRSLTFTGAINGAGVVAVNTGTVIFTGNQNYTGMTTIASSSGLQLGAGGLNGQFSSTTVNNAGVLTFSGGSVTYGGVINGGGAVAVNSGPVIFTGANGYTGVTTLANGATLQIGNGGSSGSIAGLVVANNGVLAFNRNADLTYGGAISGSGALSVTMTGATLTLTSNQTYTGVTTIAAGTLQLGALGGGGNGLTGNITNSGALTFSGGVIGYGGIISGTGTVTVNSGTVTLTGNNTYNGGTTIAGGALQLGAGGSLAGNITNTGRLEFNRGGMTTFTNSIFGTGVVSVNTGTVAFGSSQTYSGGTIVGASGVLQWNAGGSVAGDITNNGVVVFNRGGTSTISNVITGGGGVAVNAGTAILTGASNYGGASSVLGGAFLQLNDGAGLSAASYAVGGTLTFSNSTGTSYAGSLSGNGSVVKSGAGALTYGGNGSAFAGTTSVNTGTLFLNGTLGGTATVAAGATFGGTGTLSGTLTSNGGIIAAGSTGVGTVGTLTLGYLVLNGGTINFDLAAPPTGDYIHLTGAAAPIISTTTDLVVTATTGYGLGQYVLIGGYGTNTISDFERLLLNGVSGGVTTLGNKNITLSNNAGQLILDVSAITANTLAWTGTVDGNWNTATANFTGSDTVFTNSVSSVSFTDGATRFDVTVDVAGVIPQHVLVNTSAQTYTFSGGSIHGLGGLTKQGSGTLVLANDNVYDSGTTITGGTIQIGNGTTTNGSLAGNITMSNASSLIFNRTGTLNYGGNISGEGSLTVTGGLTLNLSGVHNYTGATTIAYGTVSVNGGSLGTNASYMYVGMTSTGGALVVTNGTVTANSIFLGLSSGSTATALISGTTAQLSAHSLYIGHSNNFLSNATLSVSDGGTLTTYETFIGYGLGHVGTVQITDPGSTWTVTNELVVGRGGTGSLSILNGGAVTSGSAIVGETSGSDPGSAFGEATVSGTGSQWAITNGLVIGYADQGTLTIANGGTVTSGSGAVGHILNSSTGTVVITGAGSKWQMTSAFSGFWLGVAGRGTLTIMNGGALTSTSVAVGLLQDSIGVANVSGLGSQLTSSTFLGLGLLGSGSLNISNSAAVSSQEIRIGYGTSGTNFGTGNLSISTGGSLTSGTAFLASAANTVGTASVNGPGSLWTITNNLYAGGSTTTAVGTASITVSNGAALNVGGLTTLYSTASLTLGAGGTFASGSLTGDGNISNRGAMTVGADNTSTTYSGAISGSGTFTKLGSGVLILAANQSFTGAATIAAGTLQLGNGGSTGSLASSSVANNGVLAFNRSGSFTLTGAMSGSGALNVDGGLNLTLLGTNTYTGQTTVVNGTLQVGNGGTAGRIVGNIVTNGTLTFNLSDGFTYTGAISGNGSLSVTGGGAFVFSNNHTYAGATTISAGSLTLSGGTLGSIGTPIFVGRTAAGGTLNIINGATVSSLTGNIASFGGSFGAATVSGTGSQWTMAEHVIVGSAGAGVLTITNGGVVSVTQADIANVSVATGTVTVNGAGSKLLVATNMILAGSGTGSLLVQNGGQVTTFTARIADNSGSTGSATIMDSGSQWTITGGLYVGGDPGGPNGTGLLTITNGAAVSVGGTAVIWNTGSLAVGAASTFTAGRLLGDGAIANDGSLIIGSSAPSSYSGAITGIGSLTKVGTGTLTLVNDNNYSGLTTINAGRLQLGNGGSSGSITGSIVNNGGTLIVNRDNSYAYNGVISGTGGFTQGGTGATTLGGVNLYTGGTAVNSGTLTVAGSLANSTVNVASGAVLDGSGSLGGAVNVAGTLAGNLTIAGTVTSSGSIAPGASLGTLTLANLVLNGGTLNFELNTTASSDKIILTGGAAPTVNALTTFNFSNFGGLTSGTYNLITWTGGTISNFSLTTAPTLGAFSLTLHNNAGAVALEVVLNGSALGWSTTNGMWDYDNTNFSNTGGGTTFTNGDHVTFGSQGAASLVTVTSIGVMPGSTTITNDLATPYSFTGGSITGTGSLLKNGPGSVTFSNVNTYSGATTVAGGSFIIAPSGKIANTGGIYITGSGTTLTVQSGGGQITGTGQTSVGGGGFLTVNGSASGTVVVNTGGTLHGNGTFGAIVVNNGGIMSAGNSVGSLTVNGVGVGGGGSLTLNAGATIVFEFTNATGTAGNVSGWDFVDLGTGVLNLNADNNSPATMVTIEVNSWLPDNTGPGAAANFDPLAGTPGNPTTGYFWKFLDVDVGKIVTNAMPGSIGGRFLVDDSGVFAGNNPFTRPSSSLGEGTFRVLDGDYGQGYGLYLVYSAIPEPGTMILTGLASLGAGWYGRRRLRKAKAEADAATPAPTEPAVDTIVVETPSV